MEPFGPALRSSCMQQRRDQQLDQWINRRALRVLGELPTEDRELALRVLERACEILASLDKGPILARRDQ